MKEGNIQIALPQPCHEQWEDMTPEGRGRHCAACRKTVIDFTVMTDSEIAAIFLAAGSNLPCGRFLETQLNRSLTYYPPKRQNAIAYWAKRVAAMLLLTPVLSGAYAQQKKVAQPVSKHQVKQPERGMPKQRTIKGQVLDNMTHQPVAGVRLAIATLQLDTVTDHKGRFVFVLPEGVSATGLTVASPYNTGDSFVVLETVISDSAITYEQEVVLYRHEVQRLKEHAVITREMINARPYSGVPVMDRIDMHPRRHGLRGIFRRKHS
jgi:hypothetical protein